MSFVLRFCCCMNLIAATRAEGGLVLQKKSSVDILVLLVTISATSVPCVIYLDNPGDWWGNSWDQHSIEHSNSLAHTTQLSSCSTGLNRELEYLVLRP